jgi:8-oxo-dGTP pyrophosphatase MutT (NUDIX family)
MPSTYVFPGGVVEKEGDAWSQDAVNSIMQTRMFHLQSVSSDDTKQFEYFIAYRPVVTAANEPLSARFGVVREAFEEAGYGSSVLPYIGSNKRAWWMACSLLLARRAGTAGATGNSGIPWSDTYDVKDPTLRERVHKDALTFKPLCEEHKVWPEADKLVPWSHWVTPAFEGRRFDTWLVTFLLISKLSSFPSTPIFVIGSI